MQKILNDVVTKLSNVKQLSRISGKTQGIICIGDSSQILAGFQEAGKDYTDINYQLYSCIVVNV